MTLITYGVAMEGTQAPAGVPATADRGLRGGRPWDADVIVIGSGFGGAVTALRLSEAGHRVLVLEQGRRLSDADLLRARTDPRAYLWQPGLGMRGFFWQRILRHVAVIGGAGVGGGSIVWAGVLLEAGDDFYAQPALTRLGPDWRAELSGPYALAARMLGRVQTPHRDVMDDNLLATAAAMGREHTYGPVPVAIHFGQPGVTEPDPFFGGEGPARTGCRLCGECLLGCPYGAKNQLTRNYLHLAEHTGTTIIPEQTVNRITELVDGGYVLHAAHPWRRGEERTYAAPRVVVAAGVLGTVELLARSRVAGGLPRVSERLGQGVRTNSEAITAVLHPPGSDLSRGPTISSDFHPDDDTHTTQNRYMGGWHMRAQVGPFVDDDAPVRRRRRVLGAVVRHPLVHLRTGAAKDFLRRLTVLTTMQRHDSELALELRTTKLLGGRGVLTSRLVGGSRPPSNLSIANRVTRTYAELTGSTPLNLLGESVGGLSITAHVLGGAAMGRDASEGVVDVDHEVFGHPGLHIADASVIPANLGVNPSLTITAFAERFAARFLERHPASPVRSRASTHAADATPTLGVPVPHRSMFAARRAWSGLDPVRVADLVGDHEASFLAPLTRVAPRGLALVGLPRWYGKRIALDADGHAHGVNLLRARVGGGVEEVMPMVLRDGVSLIDGLPVGVVEYAPGTRKPWPWVRDELRRLDAETVLGMTVVDVWGLRALGGTPFLLHRR
ncbi:FAD-dependent oxidoreductase [Nocardioides yefusunii]|uniref:Cholesterol oxidase n=1 Tax=Nocardioides yefusunii TaxID=2500546 RepID=A0ABW1QT85_9ACTN|nr:GMC family oxidoreductase [Nocardioides yefusunii]